MFFEDVMTPVVDRSNELELEMMQELYEESLTKYPTVEQFLEEDLFKYYTVKPWTGKPGEVRYYLPREFKEIWSGLQRLMDQKTGEFYTALETNEPDSFKLTRLPLSDTQAAKAWREVEQCKVYVRIKDGEVKVFYQEEYGEIEGVGNIAEKLAAAIVKMLQERNFM